MNDMSYLVPVIRKGYGAVGVVLKPSLYIKDNILMVRPRTSDLFFSLLGMIPGVNLLVNIVTFLQEIFSKRPDYSKTSSEEDLKSNVEDFVDIAEISELICRKQSRLYCNFIWLLTRFPIIDLFIFYFYCSKCEIVSTNKKPLVIKFLQRDSSEKLAQALAKQNPSIKISNPKDDLFGTGILRVILWGWAPIVMLYAFSTPLLSLLGLIDDSTFTNKIADSLELQIMLVFGFYGPIILKLVRSFAKPTDSQSST